MERTIVRLAVFGISLYFIVVLLFAWNGINITFDGYVILLDYSLYRLACNGGKYHCRFARALPLGLIITDTITCIDNAFDIIPSCEILLVILSLVWFVSVSLTIVLGILHFKKVMGMKKRRNDNATEFRLK